VAHQQELRLGRGAAALQERGEVQVPDLDRPGRRADAQVARDADGARRRPAFPAGSVSTIA
jgi:hypothetical protein